MAVDGEIAQWRKDLQLFRDVFEESQRPQKLAVLVVEDCEEDFFLITRCLNAMSRYDVSITHAWSYEDAVELSKNGEFDLLIVDFWLGEKTGPHVLDELGGRCGKAPSILVTGLDHPAYKSAALKAGAIQCMSKDILTGTGLQDTVSGVLRTYKLEMESLASREKDGGT